MLQQQIILHCNSLQILSIPKHTARQGSQCSDKKTARCNKSYIKKRHKECNNKGRQRKQTQDDASKHTAECGVHCCFSAVLHFA